VGSHLIPGKERLQGQIQIHLCDTPQPLMHQKQIRSNTRNMMKALNNLVSSCPAVFLDILVVSDP
jgi:hypothetical protein